MDQVLLFFETFSLLTLVKILIVVLLTVYMVFAGLMSLQIRAMTRAIVMKDDFLIIVLGLLHFAWAILVFLMAVFIL